jgi:predicted transcriptional regulator YdeE
MDSPTHKSLSDPIAVAGIKIRTSNVLEMSGKGQIGALWQRFFSEDIVDKLIHRTGDDFYVVYSNYASDEYGEYDYLIGMPVSSLDNLPEGITYSAIPTGDYAVMTSEKGPVAKVVVDVWKYIWTMPTEELGGKRTFLTDYEVYDGRAADPTDAEVEIHIGIEPENLTAIESLLRL